MRYSLHAKRPKCLLRGQSTPSTRGVVTTYFPSSKETAIIAHAPGALGYICIEREGESFHDHLRNQGQC